MGTDNLLQIARLAVRLIDLVAFDVCQGFSVADTVNPLVKEIHIQLRGPIQKELHAPLRRSIKSDVKTKLALVGKISIEPHYVQLTIYLRGLREPAYTRPEADEASGT